MARMGRPPKYNVEKIIDIIELYIKDTELPIFKEVCYLNNWTADYIYELGRNNEELSRTIKKLSAKKEVELEKGAITGKYNSTMAIFSLKQLGWKDKQDAEIDEGQEAALRSIVNAIKKGKIKENE